MIVRVFIPSIGRVSCTRLALGKFLRLCRNATAALLLVGGLAALTPTARAQKVTAVAAGTAHLLYLKSDQSLWATGYNSFGQLGDPTFVNHNKPVQVASGVIAMAGGGAFTMFVKSDGSLWALGYNEDGALGDGTTVNRYAPKQVASGVARVWSGQRHTIFLKTDNTLWTTGYNDYGQVGDSTNTSRSTPIQVATDVVSASGGVFHTFFIKRNGSLWAMGWNGYGQLGDGLTNSRNSPVQVMTAVASVSGGNSHSAFVQSDETLWTMGLAQNGVLGNGVDSFVSQPTPAKLPDMSGVLSVAAGYFHTLVVKKDKTLWAFGTNYHGQLGDGTTVNRTTPKLIATPDDVIAAAAGDAFSAFITKDGTLWTMGYNEYGQLGDGSFADRLAPVKIDGPPPDPLAAVLTASAGVTAFAEPQNAFSTGVPVDPALTLTSGTATLAGATVAIAGNFQSGQDALYFANDGATMGNIAGTYDAGTGRLTLTSAGATATVTQWRVALRSVAYANSFDSPATATRTIRFTANNGTSDSAAVTKNVSVAAVNDAPTDITLSASTVYRSAGVNAPVGTLSATDPDSVSFTYTLVSGTGSTDNGLFNISGSTLRASNASVVDPGIYVVRIQASDGGGGTCTKSFAITVANGSPPPAAVSAFAGGLYNTMFVESDGTLWGVGDNSFLQLGDGGGTGNRSAPVLIASGVASVAAGSYHTMFVKIDGTLWGNGMNQYRQLGDGTVQAKATPVQVATGVVAVAVGLSHSTYLKTDRTVWAMGDNSVGQLGDGTTSPRTAHVLVATNVAAIAVGGYHSLFLKTNGTLWSTGYNNFGQLGDGTQTTRGTPMQIATDVAAVAAGLFNTAFIKTDRSLWIVGANSLGQLGDGTNAPRSNPEQVATDVALVSLGSGHTVFVRTDGTLWTMGDNTHGQLGDGTNYLRYFPIQVATDVIAAAAGDSHTLFTHVGGVLWGMGNNSQRQLSDGSATDRNTPVQLIMGTGASGPAITAQPSSQMAIPGQSLVFTVAASGNTLPTYQWQFNGGNLSGATNSTLTLANVQPIDTGLYSAIATSGAACTSEAALVGVWTTSKVIGDGAEVGSNIYVASNGNTFDQVLLNGPAATVTADYSRNQITRTSFVDLTDDIVQVEMSGPGTLSIVLEDASGPTLPINYNQSVSYMKGHAGIVITGATEATNVSVFSVGRITAVNQALFKNDVTYDGLADIAFIAISSANGKFGGVRTANTSYFADQGLTGLYAPGVQFVGPVYIGDISASNTATPVIILGSSPDTRITGGTLLQTNGRAVKVTGLPIIKFTDGVNSHGIILPAQYNRGRLEQYGTDVTNFIVINPLPMPITTL